MGFCILLLLQSTRLRLIPCVDSCSPGARLPPRRYRRNKDFHLLAGLFCSCIFVLFCCCIVILLYCHIVEVLCIAVVVLLYCYIVVLPSHYIATLLHYSTGILAFSRPIIANVVRPSIRPKTFQTRLMWGCRSVAISPLAQRSPVQDMNHFRKKLLPQPRKRRHSSGRHKSKNANHHRKKIFSP